MRTAVVQYRTYLYLYVISFQDNREHVVFLIPCPVRNLPERIVPMHFTSLSAAKGL